MEKAVFVCTLRPTLDSGASSLNSTVCAGDTEIVPKPRILCIHAEGDGNHLIRASKCHRRNNNSNRNHNTGALFRNTAPELGWHVNKQGARRSPGSRHPRGFSECSIRIHKSMHYLHRPARSLTPNRLSSPVAGKTGERRGAAQAQTDGDGVL